MSDITYEPTREHWTPYEPWMRDVLADDARVSWISTTGKEVRETASNVLATRDRWFEGLDLRIHSDDVPERPAGEHTDEALAQTIADAFYEGDSYDAARAAREYIDNEPDDALVDSSQQVRAEKAEDERDWWRDAARRHVAERGEAEEELVELVDERDEWKARYKALRADVERVRRNRTTLTDVLMCIADVLDRDDERGQGDRRANAIERGCGEDFRRRFVDPAPDT